MYQHMVNSWCVTLQALDPDVGDCDRLNYSIVGDTRHFDVEPSSGLVYVVSVVDLAGTKAKVEVKVSDPSGLEDTTTVEVSLKSSSWWSGKKTKSQGFVFHILKIVF